MLRHFTAAYDGVAMAAAGEMGGGVATRGRGKRRRVGACGGGV